MAALLEPEVAGARIGDCRQPGAHRAGRQKNQRTKIHSLLWGHVRLLLFLNLLQQPAR
jgi:hypothetical protein